MARLSLLTPERYGRSVVQRSKLPGGRVADIQLADGRVLDISDSGERDAPVLLWHHGTPGCAHQMAHVAEAAHRHGLRLVTYSRPGYSNSTRHAGRTIADVAADSAAVLDALGVDSALVAGVSGGGPHALACGALLPERFTAVLVIVGVAPYDAADLDFLDGMGQANLDEFGAALQGEAALQAFLEDEADRLRQGTAADLIASWRTMLPEADQAVLSGEIGVDFMAGVHGALTPSVDGWVDDDIAFTKPWGFDVATVQVPTSVWAGGLDQMVPVAHGRWLAAHVPTAHSHLYDDEGHISIRVGYIDAMLDDLLDLSRS